MKAIRNRARALAGVLAAGALSGCISVFPKEPPAQLYRFGGEDAPAQQPARQSGAGFAVMTLPIGFDRPAAGDAILTMTGEEAAYIKGSRWVAPAVTLFESALVKAFDADAGPARLIVRGDATRADYILKLDVRRFEARYDHGQASAPTIAIEVHAMLSSAGNRDLVSETLFTASQPAAENRAGAIAVAFDQATGKVLGDVTRWVDAKGGGAG